MGRRGVTIGLQAGVMLRRCEVTRDPIRYFDFKILQAVRTIPDDPLRPLGLYPIVLDLKDFSGTGHDIMRGQAVQSRCASLSVLIMQKVIVVYRGPERAARSTSHSEPLDLFAFPRTSSPMGRWSAPLPLLPALTEILPPFLRDSFLIVALA